MEQKTSDDNSSEQTEDASISPPPKKAKRQPEENSLSSDATSDDAATIAGNLNEANALCNLEPTNIKKNATQQPSKKYNFFSPINELFSLRRKILFGFLRRILIQTQPVW